MRSIDEGVRHHRFRQVKAPWLWLVVAAVSAYLALVAIMILRAGESVTVFRVLADTPTATRPTEPAEPAGRRPSSGPPRPSGTVTPPPAEGVVFYPPADPVRTPAITPTAALTPTPTPTPVTIPAELPAARQAVDRAEKALRALRAGGTATAAEIQVARYELARARQNLADREAGTPGERHQDLDVLEARVYRDLAIERCRTAMTDPVASAAEQKRAYAVVRLWQKRLDDLLA